MARTITLTKPPPGGFRRRKPKPAVKTPRLLYHGTVLQYSDMIENEGYRGTENLTVSKKFADIYAINHALESAKKGYGQARGKKRSKLSFDSKESSAARVVVFKPEKGKVAPKDDMFFAGEEEWITEDYKGMWGRTPNPYLTFVEVYIPKETSGVLSYIERTQGLDEDFTYDNKTGLWLGEDDTPQNSEVMDFLSSGSLGMYI